MEMCGHLYSLTHLTLCSQGKTPVHPLNSSLGGPQSQSICFGEEENLFKLSKIFVI